MRYRSEFTIGSNSWFAMLLLMVLGAEAVFAAAGGSVSGQVVNRDTGEPVERVKIFVWDPASNQRGRAVTNASGHYQVTGLNPGTYTATAVSDPESLYNAQLFQGQECPRGFPAVDVCDVTTGTPIVVMAEVDTPAIDFALRLAGGIAGRVTDAATGAPLSRGIVRVFDAAGNSVGSADADSVGSADADSNGEYFVGGLVAGTYFAYVSANPYLWEIYDDLPCPFFPCDAHLNGLPITVATDTVTTGINFALELGGSISGQVIDAATGEPIQQGFNKEVRVWNLDGREVASTTVGFDGRYTIPNSNTSQSLRPGSYFVTIDDDGGYLGEVWGGPYCHNARGDRCDPTTGTPVAVELRQETSGINFELEVGGRIEGRVTLASTGEPAESVTVHAWDSLGMVKSASTRADGSYTIEELQDGAYPVSTDSNRYRDQVHAGIPCPVNACDPTAGSPVPVAIGEVAGNVDFALQALGRIQGRVTAEATDEPIEDIYVQAWTADGQLVSTAGTSPDGQYALRYLEPGSFNLTAAHRLGDSGWLSELYEEEFCPLGLAECDLTAGLAITTELDTVVDGIDFALERVGTVSGTVTVAATGEPLRNASVSLYDAEGRWRGRGLIDDVGHYEMIGVNSRFRPTPLHPGEYFAFARAYNYLTQLFVGSDCEGLFFDTCDQNQGQPVTVVNATDRSGVDFALHPGGSIAGQVRAAATGLPIRSAVVWARDAAGELLSVYTTLDDGRYTVWGLPSGHYYLTVEHIDFGGELYPNLPCPERNCDVTVGEAVEVTVGNKRVGFDFELEPASLCDPDFELCLQDDAFKVTATWRDASGNTGLGHAQRLTDGTGIFWFFSPDNIELMVKVLDACIPRFDRYWIFAAGLTDVEVDLEVTHLASGETWSSNSPLGTPFAPILDTEGLAVCDASSAADGPSSTAETPGLPIAGDPALSEALALLQPSDALALQLLGDPRMPAQAGPATAGPAQTGPATAGPCIASNSNLCLADNRFRVVALWRTPSGQTGVGTAMPLTDETGTFWFFSGQNLEVIVKVLNACEAFGGYWVFAAGLTDVEVTLRITDLVTDETRDYVNPINTPFKPIVDTSTFRACP